jgi:phosphoribosylamine--glycine ligase
LLDGDLLPLLRAAAAGDLGDAEIAVADGAAVTVVIAAGRYPEHGDSGGPITGVEDAETAGALVFHAGTALRDGRLATNGGRIIDVTGLARTVAEARDRAYEAAALVSFPGARYRTDIALSATQAENVRG